MEEGTERIIARRTNYLWIVLLLTTVGTVLSGIIYSESRGVENIIMCVGCAIITLVGIVYLIILPTKMIVYRDGKLIISPRKGEVIEVFPAEIEYITYRTVSRRFSHGTLRLSLKGREVVLRQVADLDRVVTELQTLKSTGSDFQNEIKI